MSKSSGDDSTNNMIHKLDLLASMQRNEAQLHWTRNNYFLVAASILLLALSQFKETVLLEGLISAVGIVFAATWYVIQDRSSKYVDYYKKAIQKLDRDIFPEELGGVQIRHVTYVLPVAFLLMWAVILIALLKDTIT